MEKDAPDFVKIFHNLTNPERWNSDGYKWAIGPQPGMQRFQSKELMEFRATRKCIVPGCTAMTTIHHLISGRTNISSDILTSSECFEHHMIHEKIGDGEFEFRFGVNILESSMSNLHVFLFQSGLWGKISPRYYRDVPYSHEALYHLVKHIESVLEENRMATRYKEDHKRTNRKPLTKTCNSFQ